jgi:hypothetical protein
MDNQIYRSSKKWIIILSVATPLVVVLLFSINLKDGF